jgi:hypothetical protein
MWSSHVSIRAVPMVNLLWSQALFMLWQLNIFPMWHNYVWRDARNGVGASIDSGRSTTPPLQFSTFDRLLPPRAPQWPLPLPPPLRRLSRSYCSSLAAMAHLPARVAVAPPIHPPPLLRIGSMGAPPSRKHPGGLLLPSSPGSAGAHPSHTVLLSS